MIVDLDLLDKATAYLKEINAAELSQIVWVRNGEAVSIDPQALEHWHFIGLNNTDFYTIAEFKPFNVEIAP